MKTAMQVMELARHKGRPCFADWVSLIFDDFFPLCGDRCYGDDEALQGGIALLSGRPVTVVGHAKGNNTKTNIKHNFGMPHPEGYRKALRLMHQAEKFRRPVITLVDTPGAFCGVEAEERGQGEAIARNLMEMMSLNTPILSVFTGEGGSGGALGLAVSDQAYMLENAVYSVISPRGCASILWNDAAREAEAAEKLKITAHDLLSLKVIDTILPEPPGGAHKNPRAAADTIKSALLAGLLWADTQEDLRPRRYNRFRSMGQYLEGTSDAL